MMRFRKLRKIVVGKLHRKEKKGLKKLFLPHIPRGITVFLNEREAKKRLSKEDTGHKKGRAGRLLNKKRGKELNQAFSIGNGGKLTSNGDCSRPKGF